MKMPLDRSELHEVAPLSIPGRPVSVRRQWRVMISMAIVLAVVGFGFYEYLHLAQEAQLANLTRPRPPTPIEAVVATVQPVPQSISGIGTVQAVHQVTVAPEIGGRIVQIFFEPGAVVKVGDPLVQLYDAPLKGDLANYQAQARIAGLSLQRNKELSAREFQSRQIVDQQQSTLDQAQAGIAKTEAQLAQMLIKAP